MTKKITFNVGDKVRVKMSNGEPGETVYEIASIGSGFACSIREISSIPGRTMAAQPYDTSLLMHEPGVGNRGRRLLIDGYEIIRSPGRKPIWVVFENNHQLGQFTKLIKAKTFVRLKADNARTARAMNDSGAFKPFTVIGG